MLAVYAWNKQNVNKRERIAFKPASKICRVVGGSKRLRHSEALDGKLTVSYHEKNFYCDGDWNAFSSLAPARKIVPHSQTAFTAP